MKKYVYEMKCRRCGYTVELLYGDSTALSQDEFTDAMVSYIQAPRVKWCTKCNRATVQELVSVYGEASDEQI